MLLENVSRDSQKRKREEEEEEEEENEKKRDVERERWNERYLLALCLLLP